MPGGKNFELFLLLVAVLSLLALAANVMQGELGIGRLLNAIAWSGAWFFHRLNRRQKERNAQTDRLV